MANMRPFAERQAEEQRRTGSVLHLNEMSGKLFGITGVGTTCKCNSWCQELMHQDELVCAMCYADATTSQYVALEEWLEWNYSQLTKGIIPWDQLPVLPLVARVEPFGDLERKENGGVYQAINYIHIAQKNPHAKIGWWTKHPQITAKALDVLGTEMPKNVMSVVSSPKLNRPLNYEKLHEQYPFVDKIFTVYTPKFIEENGIEINCGGKACRPCMLCYDKEVGGSTHYINGKLKRGRKPYEATI